MWHVALGWHATEFVQTSAVFELYFPFRFWPYHHIILHHSAKFYPNRTTHGRNMTSCRFSKWRISAILDFMDPIIGSLKSPCTTSYRSSIDTIALNCLVFLENHVFAIWRQTDEQMDTPVAWSRSRCRERRLNIYIVLLNFTASRLYPYRTNQQFVPDVLAVVSLWVCDPTLFNKFQCTSQKRSTAKICHV